MKLSDLKIQFFALAIALALAFVGGRYSVKSGTHSVDVTVSKDTETEKIVTRTKLPNGAETITVTERVKTSVDSTKKIQTVVTSKHAMTNISALAAVNYNKKDLGATYGISVSHEVFGPLNAGAFLLDNGTIGVSVGINF